MKNMAEVMVCDFGLEVTPGTVAFAVLSLGSLAPGKLAVILGTDNLSKDHMLRNCGLLPRAKRNGGLFGQ